MEDFKKIGSKKEMEMRNRVASMKTRKKNLV